MSGVKTGAMKDVWLTAFVAAVNNSTIVHTPIFASFAFSLIVITTTTHARCREIREHLGGQTATPSVVGGMLLKVKRGPV